LLFSKATVRQGYSQFGDMSPSDCSESVEGDPATYEHIQQALFSAGNNTGSSSCGIKIDPAIEARGANASGNIHSKVLSNSTADAKVSNANSSTTEASFGTKSKITSFSNLPLITSSQQNKSREGISVESSTTICPKSGLSEGLPVVNKLEGATPIKPKPPLIDVKVTNAVASEASSKTSMNNPSIVPAATQTNGDSSPTKTTERSYGAPSAKSKGTARRRGKWTTEEEEYVARVIQDFNSGFLNAPAGYTLRSYLSDKLQCDPMRITKKFTGESCIGKRVFHPAVRNATNAAAIDKAQAELDTLERRWRRRLEMQQRESVKKAAASAAAANAASRGATVQGVPVSMLGASSQSPSDSQLQQSAVTRAATWLDRANVILLGNIDIGNQANSSCREKDSNESYHQRNNKDETASNQSGAEDSLEHQLKELQSLICEGPSIQQTTAGLPNLLLQPSLSTTAPTFQTTPKTDAARTITAGPSTSGIVGTLLKPSSAHVSPSLEPADKRMRTTFSDDLDTTGDAEALVDFVRSVRASAAAGQEL